MKVALGQLNPTIGDFEGNVALAQGALGRAHDGGADLLLLSELFITGYPPRDLLERPLFVAAAQDALARLAKATIGRPAIIVGFPEVVPTPQGGRSLANSAAVLAEGRVVSVHRKSLLPTYDVFDEWRYFQPSTTVACATIAGKRVGVSVCEDIWNDAHFWPERRYPDDPIEAQVAAGAEILVNLSASPFTLAKRRLRPLLLANTARHWKRPLLFCNQVGGPDDLLFDGSSAAFDATGTLIARGAEHAEDLVMVDLATLRGDIRPFDDDDARAALQALVLGVRDYARRCGFSRAVLGLSGGIDSALVAVVAVRALGPENVVGVAMPSRYSSAGSLIDARALAVNLGIRLEELPIESVFQSYLDTLGPVFAGRAPDVTEENLQARVRGGLLMALSNKTGALLLTTGNKSELATGYCTLYGDMCGGLAVISDVPKTLVYRMAHAINAEQLVIPTATITKAPSAELRPDQTDQDSLPPYDVLDAILDLHVEQGLDSAALVERGFAPATVQQVVRLVRLSEYKRRQAAPGIKLTSKAFGTGRRYPIAQAFLG